VPGEKPPAPRLVDRHPRLVPARRAAHRRHHRELHAAGAIILDHDGGGNRQQTIDALTIALPRLIDAGYHFTQP